MKIIASLMAVVMSASCFAGSREHDVWNTDREHRPIPWRKLSPEFKKWFREHPQFRPVVCDDSIHPGEVCAVQR